MKDVSGSKNLDPSSVTLWIQVATGKCFKILFSLGVGFPLYPDISSFLLVQDPIPNHLACGSELFSPDPDHVLGSLILDIELAPPNYN